ncbi:MAG: hypothetical protein ACRDG4_21300, partial [Chloroflexota bacterium]
ATPGSEDQCSNPLSYRSTIAVYWARADGSMVRAGEAVTTVRFAVERRDATHDSYGTLKNRE